MKTWMNAELQTLSVVCTEQGVNLSKQFDEIRVDQNGKYWASFGSGADSKPITNGTVITQ